MFRTVAFSYLPVLQFSTFKVLFVRLHFFKRFEYAYVCTPPTNIHTLLDMTLGFFLLPYVYTLSCSAEQKKLSLANWKYNVNIHIYMDKIQIFRTIIKNYI